jgi:two-component system chemotaxis response regulator CheB
MPRVLIVDDSPTFRGVLRGILAAAPGVEVVGEAGDGEEAVSRALALRPEVITMDVRMPKRNGLDAIKEIMRVAPTPIVVVSAAARDASEAVTFEALKLGALEVLEKPQALDAHRYNVQAEAIRQAVRAAAGVKLATRHRERSEKAADRACRRSPFSASASAPRPAARRRCSGCSPTCRRASRSRSSSCSTSPTGSAPGWSTGWPRAVRSR